MTPHKQQEESWEKEIVRIHRPMGKSIQSYLDFFENGKKGLAVIYATPEGDFMSPKAIENLLLSNEAKVRKECGEALKGLTSYRPYGMKDFWCYKIEDVEKALESAASAITNKDK